MSKKITLFEVGARDGLQNEAQTVALTDKVALVDKLSACGFKKIEAASFVSPKWVPQMADSDAVMVGIERRKGVKYTALTPNMQGYERAVLANCDEVAVFASATEGFSQKNINCSIAESLQRFAPVLKQAHKDGIAVRAYVSCIVRCPYDGDVPTSSVAELAEKLLDMGCYEISLGDTIGAATPDSLQPLLDKLLLVAPADKLAGHYHDSADMAIKNIAASLPYGLRVFDSAAGGLGGCPYVKKPIGNVATEKVADYLTELGYDCGIDRDRLSDAANFAQTLKS